MHPTVSIIVVTFNAASHIEHVIRSFVAQTYSEKELIIIDGGSTDETISIIKKFQHPEIKWISERDNGIYDAMNKGICLASGDWLYFMGADDYFKNESVLEAVFCEDLSEVDIVYGDVYSIQLKRNYDGPTNTEKLLFSNLCHQSIFYRKSVFERLGNYSLDFKLFSDWEFNLRCFLNPQIQTKYKDLVIAIYADSGASTVEKDLQFNRHFLFPFNLKYLNEHGISKLKSIRFYDRWWRLARSLKLTTGMKEANEFANGENIPPSVKGMIRFQNRLSSKLLNMGVFSKMFMTFSYITFRLRSAINA